MLGWYKTIVSGFIQMLHRSWCTPPPLLTSPLTTSSDSTSLTLATVCSFQKLPPVEGGEFNVLFLTPFAVLFCGSEDPSETPHTYFRESKEPL